jgi:hypothetical protein
MYILRFSSSHSEFLYNFNSFKICFYFFSAYLFLLNYQSASIYLKFLNSTIIRVKSSDSLYRISNSVQSFVILLKIKISMT